MNQTAAIATINPSYWMPDLLLKYHQASGAFSLLAGDDPMVRLGDGDLAVYIKTLDIRTRTTAGQTSFNQLPSVVITPGMISTPTYNVRVRGAYDHHDTAAAGQFGYSLVAAQQFGMRQGIFQLSRNALLYGMRPASGEGLINTPGAVAVNLPPDSNGHMTATLYLPNDMAVFLLSQVSAAKQRGMQLGMPARAVITGPQRILGPLEYQGIVELTSYQRAGAGSAAVAGMVGAVLEMNDDDLEWTYDDTLIGKGAGGTDMVIISIPEIKRPDTKAMFNTNEWATNMSPGLDACNIMLTNMAAPREIPAPLPGGAIDIIAEQRITSGWGLRPEMTTLLSIPYE